MRPLLCLPALLIAAFAGCADVPAPGPSPPEPVERYPGYCVAESEIDGEPGVDGVRTARYDGGLLVADEFDSDVDGDADVLTTYAYDDRERLVGLEIDRYADGELDEIRTYAWDGDRMTRETWDEDADGEVDVDITYTHDDQGRRLRGEGQRDGADDPEIVLVFEYGPDEQLAALYIDGATRAADGVFDRIVLYAYDDAGNMTAAFFDLDGDGVANLSVTYHYDCWTDAE